MNRNVFSFDLNIAKLVHSLTSIGSSYLICGPIDVKLACSARKVFFLHKRAFVKVLDLRAVLCYTGKSNLRYSGAVPFRHLNMIIATLYTILSWIFSQCSFFKCVVILPYLLMLHTILQDIFCIHCNLLSW